MIAARRRAEMVARMRNLAQAGGPPRSDGPRAPAQERCDICHTTIPDDHRHMLHLVDRRIICTCEACWALYSGNAEYRPTGMRTLWLDEFRCDDEIWAAFQIPIGLAFFMRSTVTDSVVAFYPSPAGATESELTLEAWEALVQVNPALEQLEPDSEALVVNRMADPAEYAIVPIDQCYALVGLIKSRWEGISGGDAIAEAVPQFFAGVRARAIRASEVIR
ncbi:MAG: DUF5947 family protein [Candidatus Dormiibacterota bacterium]